ncbi:complement factor H-like isoform X1 [Rhincodon typus]|uniref:complement factor H-like isoform X1 n=1 Tax=Rhincodon typus TaxID=259920 RepID=UPI00202F438E|nr:complement factor H-like isoform X1 [Rhincodon typus]
MRLSELVFLIAICGSYTGQSATYRSCGPPPKFEVARAPVSDIEVHAHGTEINYNCMIGYVGRLRQKCVDGVWRNANTQLYCKLKPCGSPGDILHGTFQLVEGDDLVFGARIKYTCDEGYRMVGTKNYRICEVDGWSGQVPYCEVVTCSPAEEPENGKIIRSGRFDLEQNFPFGSVLQFECNSPELDIEGVKEIYCLGNGTWSHPVPKCKEFRCTEPVIENGNVISNERIYKYSQKLKYQCNRNYRPENIQETTCSKYGWNPLPTCTPIVCTIMPIDHGNFQTAKWMFSHGEKVDYTCDRGYKPSDSKSVICEASGWNPNPRCVAIRCPLPNIDAVFEPSYAWSFGLSRRITYICRNSNRREQSTCTLNGWDPHVKCPGPCSLPPKLDHGYFVHSRYSYASAFIGNYRCNHRYMLQENGNIKCEDGEWHIINSIPICIELGCGKPPALINGKFTPDKEKYYEGTQINYRCNRGFHIYGPKTLTCSSKGWAEAPICIDRKLNCPSSPDVANANKIIESTHSVIYQCLLGYEMEGSERIQCINGQWSEVPTCNIPGGCEDPPSIKNGDQEGLSKQWYQHGDIVTYRCQNSFILDGPNKVKCSSGKWSAAPRCIPPCSISVQDLEDNDVQLDWSLTETVYLKHGDRVKFKCPSGLHIQTPAERFCRNGSLEIPKCLSEENTFCSTLQYLECPGCATTEICVEYNIQKVTSSRSDPSRLSLVALNGIGNASFKVQKIQKTGKNILKFAITESTDAIVNVKYSNEQSSIQYNNPVIGDYCLTFPTDNFITFNVTFSRTFSITFKKIT